MTTPDDLAALLDVLEAARAVDEERDDLLCGLAWMQSETGYDPDAPRDALERLHTTLARFDPHDLDRDKHRAGGGTT